MTSRLDPVKNWRAVCPNFGQAIHTTHVRFKETLEKAKVVAAENDHLYRRLTIYRRLARDKDSDLYSYYRSEIGWEVQKQTGTEWETVA